MSCARSGKYSSEAISRQCPGFRQLTRLCVQLRAQFQRVPKAIYVSHGHDAITAFFVQLRKAHSRFVHSLVTVRALRYVPAAACLNKERIGAEITDSVADKHTDRGRVERTRAAPLQVCFGAESQ